MARNAGQASTGRAGARPRRATASRRHVHQPAPLHLVHRARRRPRRPSRPEGTSFTVLALPLDVDSSRAAGEGAVKRSRVVVAADGKAVVTWGEAAPTAGPTCWRAASSATTQRAPQDITLDARRQGGRRRRLPRRRHRGRRSIRVGRLPPGHRRALADRRPPPARRFGSQFEGPVVIDGRAEPARAPRIDLAGKGHGGAVSADAATAVFGATWTSSTSSASRADRRPTTGQAQPVPTCRDPERGDVVAAWRDRHPARPACGRKDGEPGFEAELSPPTRRGRGLTRPFDVCARTVPATPSSPTLQGDGDDQRIMAARTTVRPDAFVVSPRSHRGRRQDADSGALRLGAVGCRRHRVAIDGVAGHQPHNQRSCPSGSAGLHR